MNLDHLSAIKNSQSLDFNKVPVLDITSFRNTIINTVKSGFRLSSLFGVPDRHFAAGSKSLRLIAVLTSIDNLYLLSAIVDSSYRALTPDCIQAHLFEREILEQYGVKPEGHPCLKPVRFQKPLDPPLNNVETEIIGSTNFFTLEGIETHEVAVGPVHAGVIEPGHFRFQSHGENVYNLEISLGYQHRGIEAALMNGPDKRTQYLIETAAGDTTAGHTTAYSQIIEALSGSDIPEKSQAIRAVALELERIANHVGDLGALSGDVGYLPTNSFCGRIRGDFLNVTANICGNRFSRGLIIPGGVQYDIDSELCSRLSSEVKTLLQESKGAISLLWKSTSVLSRFERTGMITEQICHDLGLVGVAARACNIEQDVRQDQPFGMYKTRPIPIAAHKGGDVFSRAWIRWLEIKNSAGYILDLLDNFPSGTYFSQPLQIRPLAISVSMVEGWRGEICHTALTDEHGKFIRYKIVDPSFHNWKGLAMALHREAISDFPLCNKSFNLSYCGHDL